MAGKVLINGHYYAWSSCEAQFQLEGGGSSTFFPDLRSLTYSSKLAPGRILGSRANIIGRTTGRAERAASFEAYRYPWDEFLKTLGDDFGSRRFDLGISYADQGVPVSTVRLIGCRITSLEDRGEEGPDAIVVAVELDVLDVLYNMEANAGVGQSIARQRLLPQRSGVSP